MDLAKLSAQLKIDEGVRLMPYADTQGQLTIGTGHNLTARGITSVQADWLLHDDIMDTINDLSDALPWFAALNEPRQRALANMAFNLGVPGLMTFTRLLAALRGQLWHVAHDEALSSAWAGQVGARAVRIANVFLTGTD